MSLIDLLIVALIIAGIQTIIYGISRFLHWRISEFLKKNKSDPALQTSENRDIINTSKLVDKTRKIVEGFGFITTIIGVIESTLFIFVARTTFVGEGRMVSSAIVETLPVAGAWVALKIIGNYQQWGEPILGRARFYTFFIGTTGNITASIWIGIQVIEKLLN